MRDSDLARHRCRGTSIENTDRLRELLGSPTSRATPRGSWQQQSPGRGDAQDRVPGFGEGLVVSAIGVLLKQDPPDNRAMAEGKPPQHDRWGTGGASNAPCLRSCCMRAAIGLMHAASFAHACTSVRGQGLHNMPHKHLTHLSLPTTTSVAGPCA